MERSRAEEPRRKILDDALAEIAVMDLAVQARKGGFACMEREKGGYLLDIPSFGGRIEISMPEGKMAVPPLTDSLSLRVLALRYVKLSSGVPKSGEWVAYRDLPGGRFYAATLAPTVEQPLARVLGGRRGALRDACRGLGGEEADFGDEAFVFHAFPRVPLLLVHHAGGDEFPADCRVLFDRCCASYLNTDDLKVLATQLAAYIIKGAGGDVDTENLLWMVE